MLIYQRYKNKKNGKTYNSNDLFIKVFVAIILISFVFSTYKYITKEFNPSDVKLNHDIDSSTFYAIGYDERFEKAVLIFKNDFEDDDGVFTEYVYSLPKSVWEDFKYSSSLGGFYNENIKGKYKCEKFEVYDIPSDIHDY